MNTHLGKVEERLKAAGCVFYKNGCTPVSWLCMLDGKRIANEATKPLCIKAAAKALGEPV
jgi:hypothetical protein